RKRRVCFLLHCLERERERERESSSFPSEIEEFLQGLVLCPSCRMILRDPVTVSCGHSFCKRCLGETSPPECCLCGEKLGLLGSRKLSSNVLLGNLLEKGLDTAAKVAQLKRDLRELVSHGDFQEALRTLQKGIGLGKVCVLSREDAYFLWGGGRVSYVTLLTSLEGHGTIFNCSWRARIK
uniref:RING-type domain-containing protein n=1 Tax=Pseudonaja textilis TaxID=8673 RepID=A0A670ZA94_PSETE